MRYAAFAILTLSLCAASAPTRAQSAPGAPTDLRASVTGNAVTLSWSAPIGAVASTTYTIVARLAAGAPPVATLDVGTPRSLTVSAPNGVFLVSVRAANGGAVGPESPAITLIVPGGGGGGAPGTPLNLTASVSGTTVALSWIPAGAAASFYTLFAALTPTGPSLTSFTVTQTSVTIGNVPAGTYYVRVSASNAAGSSAVSDAVAVVVGSTGSAFPVTVSQVDPQQIGGNIIASSTRLAVSWSPPSSPVGRYIVTATDPAGGQRETTLPLGSTSTVLTGLKASTPYTITVRACTTTTCTGFVTGTASGTTAREFWQLLGSGNTVGGLTPLVSDGNVRISATRFGSDAGAMAGRVQLYYGPRSTNSQLAVGVASGPADAANPASFLTFTSRAGVSGLLSPSPATALVGLVATGQGVPLSAAAGGRVRLFFEAQGADGRTRVMWLDSQDGYVGQDFNAGAGTTCATTADYSSGCVPTVAISVDGDVGGNPGLRNARQHKVAWPVLDSPHWDLSPGTFMVVTTDMVAGCSSASFNHAYAVWQGAAWTVDYAANGCPKLFTNAQAAFPMHLGGARYKMYYGDPSIQTGRVGGSRLPFLGPKLLIYADGAATGAAGVVDFEDWEPQTAARDVVFLWPDGQPLDATAEGYIDDFHFLAPTGSLDVQVMYLAITDGTILPFTAAAVLRNP